MVDPSSYLETQAEYFTCVATLVYIRKEACLYMACPSGDCNKKVIDQHNGLYRCEKCNKEFPNFKYRLLLSVSATACASEPLPIFIGTGIILHEISLLLFPSPRPT